MIDMSSEAAMSYHNDNMRESSLAAAKLFLLLGQRMEQAACADEARYYYQKAIRQGLIARRIDEHGGISIEDLQEIQFCNSERLLELIWDENSNTDRQSSRHLN
jgi:hypothetical protein